MFQKSTSTVSPLHKCITEKARRLCIFDLAKKLKHSSDYDIGGTYTTGPMLSPEFWFLYKTSYGPGDIFLLSLFVCHRMVGGFSIGVPNFSDLIYTEATNDCSAKSTGTGKITWHSYNSIEKDQLFYIKTYSFSEKDVKALNDKTVYIPIIIQINSINPINEDLLSKIKIKHSFSDLLNKEEDKDLKIETATGKEFGVHRIVLAAHSSVLKEMVNNNNPVIKLKDIADEDMELLIEFLYTGTIKNVFKNDNQKLILIAERFKLRSLFTLIQHVIIEQIDVDNALDIALMSEEYNLVELQKVAFDFIKKNHKVLETEAWKKLNDIVFMKKLFQYIYTS